MKKSAFLPLAAALLLAGPSGAKGPEVQDFNYYKTDLHQILMVLAEVTGVRFVEDIPVSGKVTVNVSRRTSLDEVLTMILKPLGLDYKVVGNVYHVVKRGGERLAPERPGYIQKTFQLDHISAGDAARRVRKLLRARGVVSVDLPMNRITVTLPPALMPEVENEITAADIERQQQLVAVRVKLVELDYSDDLDAEARLIWKKYEASLGIASIYNSYLPGIRTNGEDQAFFNNAFTFRVGVYNLSQFMSILRLVSQNDHLDTVSESDMILQAGWDQDAEIMLGQKAPNTTLNQYEDVGTRLKLRVSVDSESFIKIEVKEAELTRYAGSIFSLDQNRRYIKTDLHLLNGDTGRLGGLLLQQETVVEVKTPLLGDLPLLGFLFKDHASDVNRRELVVLISPFIIEDVPPHGRRTPGISALAAWLMPNSTDVMLDWSEDVPLDNVGVFQYRVYRDVRPIASLEGLSPIADSVSRAASSWIDLSPKRRGVTYYYAVIAVDGAGNEQAVSNSPAITVPRR